MSAYDWLRPLTFVRCSSTIFCLSAAVRRGAIVRQSSDRCWRSSTGWTQWSGVDDRSGAALGVARLCDPIGRLSTRSLIRCSRTELLVTPYSRANWLRLAPSRYLCAMAFAVLMPMIVRPMSAPEPLVAALSALLSRAAATSAQRDAGLGQNAMDEPVGASELVGEFANGCASLVLAPQLRGEADACFARDACGLVDWWQVGQCSPFR